MPRERTRRTILLGAGTVLTASLAGCLDEDPDDTDPADDAPADTTPDDDPDDDIDDDPADTDPADEPADDEPDDDEPDDDEPDDEPADVPEDGTIELTVVEDETGDPIEGATVTLSGDSLEDDLSEESDEEGKVMFEDLEFGEYTLTVEADGYETHEDEFELDDVASYIISTVPMEPEGEDDEENGNAG